MLASRNPKQTTKLLTKRTSLGQNTRSEGSGECSDPNLFDLLYIALVDPILELSIFLFHKYLKSLEPLHTAFFVAFSYMRARQKKLEIKLKIIYFFRRNH